MRDTSEGFQVRLRQLETAAAQGHADAQCALGVMHRNGNGGPVDFAEARRLFGLAAAQGHANAQDNLGFMHHNGEGGPKDFAEARRLFGLAAAQGYADAQDNLGIMHVQGEGGPKDFAEARRLFGLAAAQDHAAAQHTLGVMYRRCEGGPVYRLCRSEAATLCVGCTWAALCVGGTNLGKARATCAKLPAGWPPAPSRSMRTAIIDEWRRVAGLQLR